MKPMNKYRNAAEYRAERKKEKEDYYKPQVGGLAGAYKEGKYKGAYDFDLDPIEDKRKWDFLD
jgi:hypothetical protein